VSKKQQPKKLVKKEKGKPDKKANNVEQNQLIQYDSSSRRIDVHMQNVRFVYDRINQVQKNESEKYGTSYKFVAGIRFIPDEIWEEIIEALSTLTHKSADERIISVAVEKAIEKWAPNEDGEIVIYPSSGAIEGKDGKFTTKFPVYVKGNLYAGCYVDVRFSLTLVAPNESSVYCVPYLSAISFMADGEKLGMETKDPYGDSQTLSSSVVREDDKTGAGEGEKKKPGLIAGFFK